MSEQSERTYRLNLAMMLTDHVSFNIGYTFLGVGTVLPALVHRLGGAPLAVGLLGVAQQGGWLLPQLAAGRYVANKPLVKKYIIAPSLVGRVILLLVALAVMAWSVQAPGLALAMLILGLGGFSVADAASAVGWFSLLGKAIPADRRGRLLGVAQSLSSLVAVGAGAAVEVVLAHVGYPANYALLITLATLFMSGSILAMLILREPRGVGVQDEPHLPWRRYLPSALSILRMDPRFAWLTFTGWLAGLVDMAGAFYVLYATERLQAPESLIGLFVSAGVVGGLVSGLLGPLSDRHGGARVIALIMLLRCFCPALALAAPLLARLHPWLALGGLTLVFLLLGVINGSYLVGAMHYMLEIAPPGERSTYIALANTLSGILLLAPLAAGWIVQIASFEALFTLALVAGILALLLALSGPGWVAAHWYRSAPAGGEG